MLSPSTLSFLSRLSRNNNRDWFEEHRNEYESARADFTAFAEQVLKGFQKEDEDLAPLVIKDCLFRINRDIRFSKDKSPYKLNLAASMSRGGKKSHFAGYYIHIEPGRSFAGGGIWMPMPPETKKIRQEIDYGLEEFQQIVTAKPFLNNYPDALERSAETSLSKVPKGYEKDNPAAEYLKLKSWIATAPLTDEELTSKDLVKKVITAFKALMPLVKFLNRSLEN